MSSYRQNVVHVVEHFTRIRSRHNTREYLRLVHTTLVLYVVQIIICILYVHTLASMHMHMHTTYVAALLVVLANTVFLLLASMHTSRVLLYSTS